MIDTNGIGPLFTNPDSDVARSYFQKKSRAMTDKLMSVKQAVSELISNGDYLASGGFGANRISTAVLHEILRQKKTQPQFCRSYHDT